MIFKGVNVKNNPDAAIKTKSPCFKDFLFFDSSFTEVFL